MTHLTCFFHLSVRVCQQDVITFALSTFEQPVAHHPARHKNNPTQRVEHRQHPDNTTSRLCLSTSTPKHDSLAPAYSFALALPFSATITSNKNCNTLPKYRIGAPSCPTSATTVLPVTSRPDPVSAILSSARSATPGVTFTSFVLEVSPSRTEHIDTGVSVGRVFRNDNEEILLTQLLQRCATTATSGTFPNRVRRPTTCVVNVVTTGTWSSFALSRRPKGSHTYASNADLKRLASDL